MARKLALLIGNSEYQDRTLARLKTPEVDVEAFARVLHDPQIGGFDQAMPLINQTEATLRREIARFLGRRRRDDLLLLYFTGHGVLDEEGHLYLAAADTERDYVSATALEAAFVARQMDNSRSRRQVLILDCCYSGAFARGAKGPGSDVKTGPAFEGNGYGRVVLTATDETQYAWEGQQMINETQQSVFTYYLVQGLETGAADGDQDGQITVDEWYDYVYEQVISQTPKQIPGKWTYKKQGEIIIARNPRPVVKLVKLPDELQQSIEDLRPWVREGAVHELGRLLRSDEKGLALAAQEVLQRLADDDSRSVSAAAEKVLADVAELVSQPIIPAVTRKPVSKAKPLPALPNELTITTPVHLELIRVPAGEFLMGSDSAIDKDARENEQPQHRVTLADYYIGKYPITNEQYTAFVKATGHETPYHWQEGWMPRGKEKHPVVHISWYDAIAFCEWLSNETGQLFRLPTEAEWEKGARGSDGRIYPWGNGWDKSQANTGEVGQGTTTPVGLYSPAGDSPYGLADMAGNVWEWCATKGGKFYPYNMREDEWAKDYRKGADARVLRGGSWRSKRNFARCAKRNRDNPDVRNFYGGFRVVSPILK
jgi:formylglycine-generating enzyme required for sulfatase activity